MKFAKRLMSLILAVLLTGQLLPGMVHAAETQAEQETVLEELELLPAELLASGISGYALGTDGKVLLKPGTYADWIDRLDLTGASYALNFYHWLEDNANASGALADYERNTTILTSGEMTYYVYKVVVFEEDNVGSILTLPQDERLPKAKEMVIARTEKNNASAVAHINAVFNAFDRDHPEVFWLSGASNVLNSYSYGYDSEGKVYYSQSIYFLLKSNTFDIREANYRSTVKIKDTIAQRDSSVSSILTKVSGSTRYEKVKQLNRILTTTNSYNSNVSAAGNDAHECISALTGRTGTTGPVCEGYARAFKVLCDKLGIPCTLVDGFAKSSASHTGEAHMWNYVQMEDEKWYAVDVTWNDPTVNGITAANSGHEVESFLLVGAKSLVNGMEFLKSHPVSNTVSSTGVAFTNGPALADKAYLTGSYVPVTGIYLNFSSAKLYTGEYVDLSATLIPEDATATVVWASGDSSVASVNSDGRVTAVAPGTVTITATAGSCTASCTVTVQKPAPVYTLPTVEKLTYNGQMQALAVPGTIYYGTLEYSLDGVNYSQTVPQGKTAGSYSVRYRIRNQENTLTREGTLSVVIEPKALSAKVSGSVSKVYDGTAAVPAGHGLSVTLTGVVEGDDVKAAASYAFDSPEIGTTLVIASGITLTGADSGNYSLKSNQASAYVGNITAPAACLHENTTIQGKKAESCTTDGYTGDKVCKDCGGTVSYGQVIPATGHLEMVISAEPADCTTGGKTQGIRCAVCGTVLKAQSELLALGHNFEKGVCTRCGVKDENYVEPTQPTEPDQPDTPTEPTEPEQPGTGYRRLWGQDRYQTAFAIADELKEIWNVEKFNAVILASSHSFADALAGSYLAANTDTPILIVNEKSAAVVCEYLNKNLTEGGRIYILGGENAVPDSVFSGLRISVERTRLAGKTRYETNLKILAAVPGEKQELLVATGRDFADSLSASATGLPILLVNSKPGETLTQEQKEVLGAVTDNIYILGGASAVTNQMEAEIREVASANVYRIAGQSRYETSTALAAAFFPKADTAVAAYATTFPDGLCGGPLAYAVKAPLILTKDGKQEALVYMKGKKIISGYVLGGDGLISETYASQLFDAEALLK